MGSYVDLAVVLLSGVVAASLQLPLGTLLLLYHSSLSKHVRAQTRSLASSFISGATFMHFLLLAASCFLIVSLSVSGTLSLTSLAVLFGALLALALVAWCFYYKINGRSTELWLPRRLAAFLDSRAKDTRDNSEAFSLGLFTGFAELCFTFPLFLLSANAILHLPSLFQALALVVFTLLSVLPLIILRLTLRSGKNVADVQRWRIKNKPFFRFFSGLGYFILAVFLLAFVVLGGVA